MNTKPFSTYLVGGAVRDELLGVPVRDRDWVVVGATPEDLLGTGFLQVGQDFPVFLHPETSEEYALARTERKTAAGYTGFAVDASPHVSLEDDLARRDLTINAIAKDAEGRYVDPHGGRADLAARVLRHVSPAFSEDPVRILRVARFMARYAHLGFTVAPETLELMSGMVQNGEVDSLVPERVWAELKKSFSEPSPSEFLKVLRSCGALARVLPEVDDLYGIPQPVAHHPEVDTGVHTELVLDMACRLSKGNEVVAFAALTHDLGKALTDSKFLPSHPGHEEGGKVPLAQLCARLKVPKEHARLAEAACVHHLTCHRVFEIRTGTFLALLQSLDYFRQPQRLEGFLIACEADARGRTGLEDRPYPQANHIREVAAAVRLVRLPPEAMEGQTGEKIAERLRVARLKVVQELHGRARKVEAPVRKMGM